MFLKSLWNPFTLSEQTRAIRSSAWLSVPGSQGVETIFQITRHNSLEQLGAGLGRTTPFETLRVV